MRLTEFSTTSGIGLISEKPQLEGDRSGRLAISPEDLPRPFLSSETISKSGSISVEKDFYRFG
jgi:hypothetical protein